MLTYHPITGEFVRRKKKGGDGNQYHVQVSSPAVAAVAQPMPAVAAVLRPCDTASLGGRQRQHLPLGQGRRGRLAYLLALILRNNQPFQDGGLRKLADPGKVSKSQQRDRDVALKQANHVADMSLRERCGLSCFVTGNGG